jgi:thioredoxin 1
MAIIEITSDNFETEVLNSDKPVLIDFWAVWCGPCQMMAPIVQELAEEMPEVKVCKINVDEQMDLARQYRVMSIPTLLTFKDGKEDQRMIGVTSKADIKAALA